MNKQQRTVIDAESQMSNRDLLENVISLAGGDDWPGQWTPNGLWEFEYLQGKLLERLEAVGWINKEIT